MVLGFLARQAAKRLVRTVAKDELRDLFLDQLGETPTEAVEGLAEELFQEPFEQLTEDEQVAVLETAEERGHISESQLMAARDPETGQFVSGGAAGGIDWSKLDVAVGGINVNIPAADNTGATGSDASFGDNVEVIDFTQFLDSGEVFESLMMRWAGRLWLPTTATAEGTAVMVGGLTLTGDSESTVFGLHQYGAAPQREDGRLNISNHDNVDNDVLHNFTLAATAGFRDTTTGTGGGAEDGYDSAFYDYVSNGVTGPKFDDNDTLYMPFRLAQQEIADHGISMVGKVTIVGHVSE